MQTYDYVSNRGSLRNIRIVIFMTIKRDFKEKHTWIIKGLSGQYSWRFRDNIFIYDLSENKVTFIKTTLKEQSDVYGKIYP